MVARGITCFDEDPRGERGVAEVGGGDEIGIEGFDDAGLAEEDLGIDFMEAFSVVFEMPWGVDVGAGVGAEGDDGDVGAVAVGDAGVFFEGEGGIAGPYGHARDHGNAHIYPTNRHAYLSGMWRNRTCVAVFAGVRRRGERARDFLMLHPWADAIVTLAYSCGLFPRAGDWSRKERKARNENWGASGLAIGGWFSRGVAFGIGRSGFQPGEVGCGSVRAGGRLHGNGGRDGCIAVVGG